MSAKRPSVPWVTQQEPDTFDELIADCADLPSSLRPARPRLPAPRAAAHWEVDDACLAQVNGLDEFV